MASSRFSLIDRLVVVAAEITYAWRGMVRAPGFLLAGVVALGLGTAGPTVMYGLVAGILNPLPAAEPHEIVDVSLIDATRGARLLISSSQFAAWERSTTTFERLGAYSRDEASVSGESASPQRYQSAYFTSGVFELLADGPSRAKFRDELVRRLSVNSEVRDFALTTTLPGDGAPSIQFRLMSDPSPGDQNAPRVQQRRVSSSFFTMFTLPLIEGVY
jgi:hypothetical protein